MKKFIVLMLCACFVVTGCSRIKPDLTGDVKKGQQSPVDTAPEQQEPLEDDDNKDAADVIPDDEEQDVQTSQKKTAEDYVLELGAYVSDGGEYFAEAKEFADAVKNADTERVAYYTGGKAEYYEFLNDVNIASYTLYPIAFTQEQTEEYNQKHIYIYDDMYFVSFNVTNSQSDVFREGENVFYLQLGIEGVAPNTVLYFIPAENLSWRFSPNDYNSVMMKFISEFLTIFNSRLELGRTYPDTLDFKNEVHFVTHKMANSGFFADWPPYSLDEINEFITQSFDGNEGINLETAEDFNRWLYYHNGEEQTEDDKLFGCSYAHGLGISRHKITETRIDGNVVEYDVTMFSDFAYFTESSKYTLTFVQEDGRLPMLTRIDKTLDTGRPAATIGT